MKITCIENHYSPSSWGNIHKGQEYDYVEMKIEHNVFYVTIKNENRILDFPAKHFLDKSTIREYFLQKILDNRE